jgi:hypothetical protein
VSVDPLGAKDERDEAIGPAEAQVRTAQAPSAGDSAPAERAAVAAGEPDPDSDDFDFPTRGRERLEPGTVIGLTAVSLIAIALLWSGGEAHYRNCLEAANLKTQGATDGLSQLVRKRAIDNCSRLPF